MLCPVCDIELVISERQGIEIDYCPKCRGVWLDRGELDKIRDRTNKQFSDYRSERKDRRDDDTAPPEKAKRGHRDSKSAYKKKKRDSILEEIFDNKRGLSYHVMSRL